MTPDPTLAGELNSYLGQLGADDQARVVDFARTLTNQPIAKQGAVPGKDLLRFAGTISAEDGEQMVEAIEEGCEQIYSSQR